MIKRSIGLLSLAALGGCATAGTEYHSVALDAMNLPPSLAGKSDFETGGQDERVWPRSQNGKGITVNQTTTFDYEDTREYSVRVCSGGRLSHFLLEPGERIAAGKDLVVFGDADQTRWDIKSKIAGNRQIISLMAKNARQKTDMAIVTNKRMYAFNLYSSPNCHKIVKFEYEPIVVKKAVQNKEPFDSSRVRTNYIVSLEDGDKPAWFPINVFDTGSYKTWVEFPGPLGEVGAPNVLLGHGKKKMSAQSRIDGNFYEIVNMGDYAELTLGGSVVSIERRAE